MTLPEIPIGKRVKITPIHPLFRRWTGRKGTVMQREVEENELQYRVLLEELPDAPMPGEGYLFRRIELESL